MILDHEEDFDYLLDDEIQPLGLGFVSRFQYNTTKEKNMFKNISQKMMGRMFRKVDEAVWDLMTGKIGIRTDDGIVTLEGTGEDAQISINVLEDFGLPLPAFAQNTPVDSIKDGDLIFSASKVLGYVVKKTEKGFRILKLDGTLTSWNPPKVSMIGFDGVSGALVLRSLFNTFPDGDKGLSALQGSLMPMLMMMGDNLDLDNMLPMLLMSQNGMMGGAAGMGNMMQTMMLMNMMKGGENPMKNMFGGDKSGSSHFSRGGR